ncbi:MAG: hypothetical protein KDD45_11270 [Bdellovibrionales bacterium]|nr:hypothetical protein [Bdellovibrionales bacterium]
MAVGVDEMDWDDNLDCCQYNWPSVSDSREYRAKVKKVILDVIDKCTVTSVDDWHNDLWIVLMGIAHERIHLETSAVIMSRLPLHMVKPIEAFV